MSNARHMVRPVSYLNPAQPVVATSRFEASYVIESHHPIGYWRLNNVQARVGTSSITIDSYGQVFESRGVTAFNVHNHPCLDFNKVSNDVIEVNKTCLGNFFIVNFLCTP